LAGCGHKELAMSGELDVEDLAARATTSAQQWAPGCRVDEITFLPGGTVSIVFTGRVLGGPAGVDTVVLKVAPPGLEPRRNRDVLRQARCIDALGRVAGVPVPQVLFADPGQPVEVPPFFTTPMLAGECVEPLLVASKSPVAPDIARSRAFAAVDALAAIRKASPGAIGLGDEPVTTPADEVRRWVRTFETVPDEFRTGYQPAAEALLASAPELLGPAVIHGDYRLGNMLCDGTIITGIIDWELWTISDPRIDLSWLLFFTDEADHPSAQPGASSGMPSRDEILAAYEKAVGEPTKDLAWFDALTYFKEASATALIAKLARRRNPAGPDVIPPSFCTGLVQRAMSIVGS
jgi:aminoglycoside phosphotransferase (APT) family kinase protein